MSVSILRSILGGLAALLLGACDGAKPIAVKKSFRVDKSQGDKWGSAGEKLIWASESMLIATARNCVVQAFNPESGAELWRAKFEKGLDGIACGGDHVYVALGDMGVDRSGEAIRRLELATGKDTTPKGIPQPFLVGALVWSEEAGALCVLEHSGLTVYAPDLMSVKTRVPCGERVRWKVTSDGKSILLAEREGNCSVVDVMAGSLSHVHGPPMEDGDGSVTTDAPFLSNAFYSSGGPLIRIVDNSWATGRIHFHATPADVAKEVDSKNGHAVAAVHWPSGRLAVSGTEENLLLYSTTGDLIVEMEKAVTSRTYALAFSPSGKRVAALGEDGMVRVFEVR